MRLLGVPGTSWRLIYAQECALSDQQLISDDGMWSWDGSEWQPTEANLAGRAKAEPSQQASSGTHPVVLDGADAPLRDVQPTPSSHGAVAPVPQSQPPVEAPSRADRRAERKAARVDRKMEAKARSELLLLARSPAGRARTAFERGDRIFQCSFDVMSQQAIIAIMIGSTTSKNTSDPTQTLNAVCREGWELVTASFVFVEEGQQSRDKFLASGQNVAVKGRTMGYYVFKRNETMRAHAAGGEDLLDQALDEITDEETIATPEP